VIEPVAATDLIASFPAAGAGGSTVDLLEKFAVRRGVAYLAMSNPASIEDLVSGKWEVESIGAIRRAVEESSAQRVILVGHSMGGFSAIRLTDGLNSGLGLPVGLLIVNTPCPESSGRIPTMSHFSDAEIAQVLADDGFPQELLDDEDMLAEVADGLRADAMIADLLAEWVVSAGSLDALHVVSTRGDTFIPPEQGCAWQHRVSREFHWTVGPGGHALDEGSIEVLERAINSVMVSMQAELA
jgi:surfactin synthase thioesterase subunit